MSQSQESLKDQLNKLIELANVNGLYDAADWVARQLEDRREKKPKNPDNWYELLGFGGQ